jgi:hypothetical protein
MARAFADRVAADVARLLVSHEHVTRIRRQRG